MGMLGTTLLMVMVVVIAEAQVLFPSNTFSKNDDCTASNGQSGFCYEFRSSKFKECPFYPSQDTSNPNVARHLTENVCKKTPREVYFCCPANKPPPKRSCSTIRCQANAQCVEGSGNKPTKCNCNFGYRSYQDMCIATCNIKSCQANALCVEGSRTAASVCLCKKGFRPHNGECLPTCQATKCPENARCLEGSGRTGTSCKCKSGYMSTRTACIEMRRFGGSSRPNQRNSFGQFRTPTRNPYQWHHQNRQNTHIK